MAPGVLQAGMASAATQESQPVLQSPEVATKSVVQEIRVTASVPHHRDIVIDQSGRISEISSNTLKDVKPTVYLLSVDPKHKKPLTDKLYRQYRQHIPDGTSAYGVLYKRDVTASLLRKDMAAAAKSQIESAAVRLQPKS